MGIIFVILAGMILGGGIVGFVLSRRWQAQVAQAEQALKAIAEQHHAEVANSRELKQKVADLQFQLNQARNEVRALNAPRDSE
ncbi:hypothetical protein ACQUQU_02350 [Thalassolituus sp. LLYu03]|uniref:hypothetical protein n=1 Tax=Thalassolituus sp. LLYu03 TaxID=3421656 RepID=UPI003D2A7AB7